MYKCLYSILNCSSGITEISLSILDHESSSELNKNMDHMICHLLNIIIIIIMGPGARGTRLRTIAFWHLESKNNDCGLCRKLSFTIMYMGLVKEQPGQRPPRRGTLLFTYHYSHICFFRYVRLNKCINPR